MTSMSWLSPCPRQRRSTMGGTLGHCSWMPSCTLHGTACGLTGQAEGHCLTSMRRS
ncbi:unnamed protein product [Ixodes persulcatus]